MKPIWVFVCGTYRTASTTQYQLTRDIVEETDSGVGIGYHTEDKLKEWDQTREHRYIVCKVFEPLFNGFRGETSHGELLHRQKRIRAVMSVRDPRDIITSMRKRSEGRRKDGRADEWNFETTATENFPVWLGWALAWAKLDGVTLVSQYEEFTRNLLREARRIADHLEIELSDDLAKDIAGRYTIQAINERKREKRGEKEDEWLPSVPGIVFGSSGQWRTWLSANEQKLIEEASREYMKRFGYA